MDEERLRARRELVRQARQSRQGRISNQYKSHETGGKQFFLFRIYVTMMLVGAGIALSFFHTDTANTITESLKEAIAYEMPLGNVNDWKQKVVSVFQNNIKKQSPQQDIDTTDTTTPQTQQETLPQEQTQNTTQKSDGKTFQPDLNEDSGKIP